MDAVATVRSQDGVVVVALINKHARSKKEILLSLPGTALPHVTTLSGGNPDDYNDVGHDCVGPFANDSSAERLADGRIRIRLKPRSVNVVEMWFSIHP